VVENIASTKLYLVFEAFFPFFSHLTERSGGGGILERLGDILI